jgi:hypothetical protein
VRALVVAFLLTVFAGEASAQECTFTIAVQAPKFPAKPGTCEPDSTRPWALLHDVAYLEVYGRADGDSVERLLPSFVDFDSTGADSLWHPIRVTPWHSVAEYHFRTEAVLFQGRSLCAPPESYYYPPLGERGLRRVCAGGGDVWVPAAGGPPR